MAESSSAMFLSRNCSSHTACAYASANSRGVMPSTSVCRLPRIKALIFISSSSGQSSSVLTASAHQPMLTSVLRWFDYAHFGSAQ